MEIMIIGTLVACIVTQICIINFYLGKIYDAICDQKEERKNGRNEESEERRDTEN